MCSCGIDHWLHVVKGLQGLVGMLNVLESRQVPSSKASVEALEKHLGELMGHLERAKARQAPPKEG